MGITSWGEIYIHIFDLIRDGYDFFIIVFVVEVAENRKYEGYNTEKIEYSICMYLFSFKYAHWKP